MAKPVGSRCELPLLWLVGLAFSAPDSPHLPMQLRKWHTFGTLRGTATETTVGKCI
jgi:hypothetical protein